ncbi:MAG: hypothetical protein ACO1O1_10225 [Adhaeribacter sp.]
MLKTNRLQAIMDFYKITSEQHYQEIAAKIEALKNAEPGTSNALLLKVLIQSIVHHERAHQGRPVIA